MRTLAAICLLVVFAAGCGPRITYRYEGQAYGSKAEGLAAAQRSSDNMVAGIQPARTRIGGTLNFHSPNRQAVIERGIRKTGEPRQEILDYIAETSLISYRGLYDALVKRGSFDRVVWHESNGEHVPLKPGEFVVYLYQPAPDTSGWFFTSSAVKQERLHFDMSKTDRSERVRYWLDSIEALAKIK